MERLLYAWDPLCGWCYGFIPVLRALAERRPDLPVDLRMGGLVTGERVGPYRRQADYIRGASERMREVTGRAPSQPFFDGPLASDTVSNSARPCAVTLRVREAAPEHVVAYAHALQEGHFEDGLDLNEADTHRLAMEKAGIDADPSVPSLEEAEALVADEFAAVRGLGVTSYPTVLRATDGRLQPVPLSYDVETFMAGLERPPQDLRYGLPAGSPDP